jgi:MOSC domain-containing protein YiiM
MGRLEAIWIKRMKRGPMDPREQATLVQDRGLEGNANQGGKRQVTLIEREVFEEVERELDRPIDPRLRRANLLVSGLPLVDTRGKVLRIGECQLAIWGETRPCEKLEESVAGLRKALEPAWRGGAFATVAVGGEIKVGDEVEWV